MKLSIVLLFVFIVTIFLNLNIYRIGGRDNSFKGYTGQYVFPENNHFSEGEITLVGDSVLRLNAGKTSGYLKKTGTDRFLLSGNKGELVFQRNTLGKVSGLKAVLHVCGTKKIEGKRVDPPGAYHFTDGQLGSHNYTLAAE